MKRPEAGVRVIRAFATGFLAAFLVAGVVGCGGGGGGRSPSDEVPTTVFGRQASELAVGIAAQRSGRDVTIRTTVLAQDGTARRGLRVAFAGAGGWAEAEPCGAGRYCGQVEVAGPRPQLRVRLTRPGGRSSTVSARLPRNPE